jgi:NTP pyrophosphatase (non-canonical NTP hydrolase)
MIIEERKERYKMTIKEMCKQAHKTAVEKGFWSDTARIKKAQAKGLATAEIVRNDGEMIALMHSELSEALEALRHGNGKSDHIPEFSFLEEEMADLCIRVGDFCEARGVRLDEAIKAKMAFNKTRPHKHGKEF